jgi:hypothetical protein
MRRPDPEKQSVRPGNMLSFENDLDFFDAVIVNMKSGNETEKITQMKL